MGVLLWCPYLTAIIMLGSYQADSWKLPYGTLCVTNTRTTKVFPMFRLGVACIAQVPIKVPYSQHSYGSDLEGPQL